MLCSVFENIQRRRRVMERPRPGRAQLGFATLSLGQLKQLFSFSYKMQGRDKRMSKVFNFFQAVKISSSVQSPLSSLPGAGWEGLLKYTLTQPIFSPVQWWGWGRPSITACTFQMIRMFHKFDSDGSEVIELTKGKLSCLPNP